MSSTAYNDRLTDIEARIIVETERGLKLDDGKVQEWVPKAQVENNGDGTFTMPEWMAVSKGFV